MTVYTRRKAQPLKWLLALIIFVLAMTITFDGVYGNERTGASGNDGTYQGAASDDIRSNGTSHQPTRSDDQNPPTAIPEPTTLLLLAGGIGAMYVARRRRARQ
ncbi:MAG: PEP-CTERM sorting domain-containing protein [candidate division Zixibacteria bacterium]|nr:PEP-CTERM sorting domain-containing protein [candidate division Zixibacteria bacterium]